MQTTKNKLLDVVKQYCDANCKNGWPKSNLDVKEKAGLKELKEKIKNQEVVCFTTDKSSRISVDTIPNYLEALSVHTENDVPVDDQTVKSFANILNSHMMHYNKMFNVGVAVKHEERVTKATTTTNVPPCSSSATSSPRAS